MGDPKKTVATPMVAPHNGAETSEAPEPVDTEAPVSTDEQGADVDLPDLGGKID